MKTKMFEVTVASFIGKLDAKKEKIKVAAKDKGAARDIVVGLHKYQVPVRNKKGRCYATFLKSIHTWPLLNKTGEKRCIIRCEAI